ncbi:hypothetical protein HYE66_09585, partial [Aggregatibacter actinomycetemcomitans]|nr:hypothetical protein [Aggregatibacter actinomycetemcomitans]
MPIRPNQDYWHKINELWDQQEQQENPTQKQVTENREQTEKTPQKPTALSGWRYLYHHNQL